MKIPYTLFIFLISILGPNAFAVEKCAEALSVRSIQSKYIARQDSQQEVKNAFLLPISDDNIQVTYQLEDGTLLTQFYTFEGNPVTLPRNANLPTTLVHHNTLNTHANGVRHDYRIVDRRPGELIISPRSGRKGRMDSLRLTEGSYQVGNTVGFRSTLQGIASFPDRSLLAVGIQDETNRVAIVNTETNKVLQIFDIKGSENASKIRNLRFSPNGDYIVVIDSHGVFAFKINAEGSQSTQLLLRDDQKGFAFSQDMLFSKDGNSLILAKTSGAIVLVRLNLLEAE